MVRSTIGIGNRKKNKKTDHPGGPFVLSHRHFVIKVLSYYSLLFVVVLSCQQRAVRNKSNLQDKPIQQRVGNEWTGKPATLTIPLMQFHVSNQTLEM